MLQRSTIALCATAALAVASPAWSAVDYGSTQSGARFTFGGRDELAIDASDQMLTNANNAINGAYGPVRDVASGLANYAGSEADLGEIVIVGGNVRGVVDQMAARRVLQLLFVDANSFYGWGPSIGPSRFGVLPEISSLGTGGSGGGSEDGKRKKPPLTPPEDEPPPEDLPPDARFAAPVPEPSTATVMLAGVALACMGRGSSRARGARS